MKEREKFAKQQSDTHSVGLFGVQRQMYVLSFCLAHSGLRNGKLEAGAREESPLVAFVQPRGNIRRGRTQPVQQCGLHEFTRKGHQCSLLQWSQSEQDGVEFGRTSRKRRYIHRTDFSLSMCYNHVGLSYETGSEIKSPGTKPAAREVTTTAPSSCIWRQATQAAPASLYRRTNAVTSQCGTRPSRINPRSVDTGGNGR